jgi:hypothetical protein
MRLMSFTAAVFSAVLLVHLSATGHAQQPSGTAGDTIGHPPPLSGPPPLSEPSPTLLPSTPEAAPATTVPKPQAGEPASKGYTGAYAPAGSPPPTPYYKGPLPDAAGGSGLLVPGEDGVSTRTVRAVPCGRAARETDGSTTCVGIPDQGATRRRR